jgi:ANTAR domain
VSRPDPLTDLVRGLVLLPLSQQDVRSVLAAATEGAASVLGVPPVASMTLVSDGPARTVAASGPLALQLDSLQYRDDAGPCLHAARTGEPVRAVHGDDPRWPGFGAALAASGCEGVWSHPLPLAPAAASLNLYLPAGGDPRRREAAAAVAEAVAAPVANVWLYEEAVRTAENLRAALEFRAVIEQAKGILMERLKTTADGAFDTLVRVSNDTNTKLRDVAQAVVDTGRVPPDGPTRRSPAPR